MPEAIIQARFIKLVKEKNLGIAVKVSCASRRGWPDVTFVGLNGETTFIEFKAGKGVLSPHQKEIHAELFKLGADVVILSSVNGVDDFIRILERERDFGMS